MWTFGALTKYFSVDQKDLSFLEDSVDVQVKNRMIPLIIVWIIILRIRRISGLKNQDGERESNTTQNNRGLIC